jgi:hypothetical protein
VYTRPQHASRAHERALPQLPQLPQTAVRKREGKTYLL